VGEFEIFHGDTCEKSVPKTRKKGSGTSSQVLFNHGQKFSRIQDHHQFVVQPAHRINQIDTSNIRDSKVPIVAGVRFDPIGSDRLNVGNFIHDHTKGTSHGWLEQDEAAVASHRRFRHTEQATQIKDKKNVSADVHKPEHFGRGMRDARTRGFGGDFPDVENIHAEQTIVHTERTE